MNDSRPPAIVSLERLRASLADAGLELPLDGASEQRDAAASAVRQIDDYIRPRLADLDAPLLAVVGGSTGSGKSTIVNALIGTPTTRAGVIRPTTRQPILVHAPVDAGWFASDRILPGLARVRGRISDAGTPASAAGDTPAASLTNELMLLAHDKIPASLALVDAPDKATGWPVVSWILRVRADPLTRLGLGPKRRGHNPELHRTSLPDLSSGARAKVSLAVRGYADAAAMGLAETWRTGILSTANNSIASLPDQLDLAIARPVLPAKGSWWWVIFVILQWAVLVAGLVGVGWLLAAALLPTIGMPALEIPKVEGWAVPTLLIAGAILAGIVLGLLDALLGGLTAASRRRRARKLLLASVNEVVQSSVVAPIAADLERAREFAAALAVVKSG